MTRRPFFPGMAAPLVIEPGPFYEILKSASRSKHKLLGLILTRSEDVDIYKVKIKDLHEVGVAARILRIIPMESGGAQVVLNMERRIKLKQELKKPSLL
jgi:ATP-dependent Lon protease